MAVDIPIGANPSGIVQAFTEIRSAIARARGEAADFAAIDLSHGEIQGLGAEIKTVLKNFEDLVRIGRGATASGVRASIGASTGTRFVSDQERIEAIKQWSQNLDRQFPDRADRARNARNTIGYITQGTSLQPAGADDDDPENPDPSPRPPRRSEGFFRRTGRNLGASLGGAVAGEAGAAAGGGLGAAALGLVPEIALPLLAIAGVTGAGKMAGMAVQQAAGENQADDQFLRATQGSVSDFNTLRDAARQAAQGLMLTYEQSATLGSTFAQLANISDPNQALSGMRSAVGFGRAYGIDPETATAAFAKASLLGMDPERFATLIADATAKGNDASQTPQVMQAILNFAQNASRYLVTSDAINGATGNYASMFAAMQATGNPGLMGDNGAALLGQVNSAIMAGGAAGMQGQVATYQAFAKAGIVNPYDVQYDLSGGAFAPITLAGGKQTDAFSILRDNLFSRYGKPGSRMRDAAEANYYQINMRQAGALDAINPADLSQTSNYMFNTLGLNDSQINMAAMPDIVNLLNGKTDPQKIKAQLLGNSSLSAADAAAIKNASDPDALKKALVMGLNDTGLQQDDSTKYLQATADASNAITAMGTGLIPAVTGLKEVMANLLSPLGTISTDLDKMVGNVPASQGISIFGSTLVGPSNPKGANRPLRNNNPLDLKGGDGAIGVDGGDFGVYATVADGLAAAVRQIRRYQTRDGITRLAATDFKYSPISDNPWERETLDKIEKMTNLKDNSDLTDPANLSAYVWAKAIAEGAPISKDQASAAVNVKHDPIVVKIQHPNGTTTTHTTPNTTVPLPQPQNAP